MSELPRAEAIAREIRRDILSGRYRPGERLPSERDDPNTQAAVTSLRCKVFKVQRDRVPAATRPDNH